MSSLTAFERKHLSEFRQLYFVRVGNRAFFVGEDQHYAPAAFLWKTGQDPWNGLDEDFMGSFQDEGVCRQSISPALGFWRDGKTKVVFEEKVKEPQEVPGGFEIVDGAYRTIITCDWEKNKVYFGDEDYKC